MARRTKRGFEISVKTMERERTARFKNLEPLDTAFVDSLLPGGRKQNIKVSLLDQRNVAGLGNIYVCEALYRARISPLVAAGKMRPVIDSTYPLAKAGEAHARMETSQHIGKIVLTV